MVLADLFLSFFQIGLFSIGGGYASLPLIQEQIVQVKHWLTMTELTDVIAISQMTPGPIALNAATFVGVRIFGFIGGIVATLGFIMPSCIIAILFARYFFRYREIPAIQGIMKGLRPAVVSLIAAAGLSIISTTLFSGSWSSVSLNDINYAAVGIFALSLFVIRKYKANILAVMGGSAAVGILIFLITSK
jgi:chromate transporter